MDNNLAKKDIIGRNHFLLALIACVLPGIGHLFVGSLRGIIFLGIWIITLNRIGPNGLNLGWTIFFAGWGLLIVLCMIDVWRIVRQKVDDVTFSDISKIHRTLGTWVLTYCLYFIGMIIFIIIIAIIILGVNWGANTASQGVNYISNVVDDRHQLSNIPLTASVDIYYQYQWQGAISDGSSSYNINGFGSKSNSVESSLGIVSASAQKTDGSTQTLRLCIDGECRSTSSPFGVVSLAKRI